MINYQSSFLKRPIDGAARQIEFQMKCLRRRGEGERRCHVGDFSMRRQEFLHQPALIRRRRRHVQFADRRRRRRRRRRWRILGDGTAVHSSPLIELIN